MLAFVALPSLILLYVVASPRFAPALYRSSLFFPHKMSADRVPPQLEGVAGEEVNFGQERSYELNGWFYRKPGARYVMLVSHGNGGNISVRPSLIECILDADCSVFIYDYCGYGKSKGLPDLQNIVAAGECAYRYLIDKQKYKPEDVIVYGESLGGAVSACLAERCPTAGLIIQSGFSSLYKIAIEKIPLFGVYPPLLFPADDFDTANRMARLKVPVLIIHGTDDGLVPVHHGEAIYAAAKQPKTILILQGARHTDITELYKYKFVAALRQFVRSLPANNVNAANVGPGGLAQ